jgi:peptide-methionine (R)-S-oxide reductase
MKPTLLIVVGMLMSTLMAEAQRMVVSNTHPDNPYYSTTDTNRLHVSNAQWKKILPPALYAAIIIPV